MVSPREIWKCWLTTHNYERGDGKRIRKLTVRKKGHQTRQQYKIPQAKNLLQWEKKPEDDRRWRSRWRAEGARVRHQKSCGHRQPRIPERQRKQQRRETSFSEHATRSPENRKLKTKNRKATPTTTQRENNGIQS